MSLPHYEYFVSRYKGEDAETGKLIVNAVPNMANLATYFSPI